MNEDLENMKYGDLRKYAKNLGLTNVGKKEYLIQLIREHFEKNNSGDAVVERDDAKVIEENVETPSNVIEKKDETTQQEPAAQTDKVKGKRGRKKKKDENEPEMNKPTEDDEQTTAPVDPPKPATPQKVEKQSRKGAIKKELPTPIAPPPPVETPKVEQKLATPQIKETKKAPNKKEQVITPPTTQPSIETPATASNNKRESPTSQDEQPVAISKVKKLKTKKATANKKDDEKPIVESPPPVNEQQVPVEEPIPTKKDEEKPAIVVNNEINSSLISNDQQIKSNDSLITNDESTSATPAVASNRQTTETLQKNLDKTYDCPKLPLVGSTPLHVSTKQLNSTYDKENKIIEDLENTGKKPVASNGVRPRIVIPKENGVEVKQRTAGPRIVIPPEAENQKKAAKVDSNKKIKVVKPDFKAIHKKMEDKLESIDTFEKRKVERHESLTGKKVVVTKKVLIEKTIENQQARKDDSQAPTETKQTTPPAPLQESTQQQSAVATGIPRLIKKQEPAAAVTVSKSPKTPRRTSIIKQSSITTPSTIKKSAQKPRLDIAKPSSSNLNTSISTQMSSYSKRKSFDINASLARPMKYNPHTGKIKPVTFDSNSIFINKHKQSNLNSSVLSTTIQQQQQQQKPSRTSIIIKNKDSIKDMLHDQIKTNSNAAKEKFRANEVKLRKEQRMELQMNNRNIIDS